MKKTLPYLLLILSLGFLSVQWLWPENHEGKNLRQYSEKINLALRQTGHQLLTLNGDSTSTIFPVSHKSENEFVLQLNQAFKYDTLPYLLEAALGDYGISDNYHVAVKNCETDTVILGYNLLAFENKNVACLGREQWSECNNISVVFEGKNKGQKSGNNVAVMFALAGAAWLGWTYFSEKKRNGQFENRTVVTGNETLKIGGTEFDFKNQLVVVCGEEKSLTFRENKLLQYFVEQPGQVLEREKILSDVWGDEGVIVGRSLDVFVSRLRKILKADSLLKIKNVHGVGYRLEVGAS